MAHGAESKGHDVRLTTPVCGVCDGIGASISPVEEAAGYSGALPKLGLGDHVWRPRLIEACLVCVHRSTIVGIPNCCRPKTGAPNDAKDCSQSTTRDANRIYSLAPEPDFRKPSLSHHCSTPRSYILQMNSRATGSKFSDTSGGPLNRSV